MCVLLYLGWVGGCWKEGKKAAQEEEDIIGDFPPCLHCLKHLHLVVFFEVSTQSSPVYPDAAQEARSDIGKGGMVLQGYSS